MVLAMSDQVQQVFLRSRYDQAAAALLSKLLLPHPPEYTRGPSMSTRYEISSAHVTRVLQQQQQR
jgi:hypothetical protein